MKREGEEFLLDVIRLAQLAGEAILKVYNDKERWDVCYKEDASPVTAADIVAHEIISEGLKTLTPGTPILSEEGEIPDYDIRQKWSHYWLVDPLDGTKEFIQRHDTFTVNIAYLTGQGALCMGVVVVPVKSETYWAVRDRGAFFKGPGHSTARRLFCSTFRPDAKQLRICCSRNHGNALTESFLAKYPDHLRIATGSSLKFLLIAAGEADLYPRLGPTSEWDTAAAQVILEEAGGTVEVLSEEGERRNQPVHYNKESLLNPFFLASGRCCL